jgi:hypothetical protein
VPQIEDEARACFAAAGLAAPVFPAITEGGRGDSEVSDD